MIQTGKRPTRVSFLFKNTNQNVKCEKFYFDSILKIFLFPLLLLTSACASVTQSNTQSVSVQAVCEGRLTANTNCTLKNDKGQWELQTPGTVQISKSYEGLLVACEKNGAKGGNAYVSKNNVGTWGNVLLGGGIGYLVDVGSGSGFDYPDRVTVVLQPPCPNS